MRAWIDRAVAALTLAALAAATPAEAKPRLKPEVGKASWYGLHRAGRKTASGSRLKPNHLVAASPTLPLGTVAKVTNLKNGRSVKVKVVDRGPVAKHRILDVSPRAAAKLHMKTAGVAPVKVTPVAGPKG